MASIPGQTPPNLSLRNGCRCVPEPGVTIEELLVVVGERVGFDNIVSASRMNKAVVVFLKTESLINQLTVSGIWVKEKFVPVTPLSAPATKSRSLMYHLLLVTMSSRKSYRDLEK